LLESIEQLRREIAETPDISQKKKIYQQVDKTAGTLKRMEIDALGDSHPQVADTFQLLSTIALEQNKHGDAIECLQKAIKISKGSLGMKHPRIGQYYLRLARIHLSQEIESLALECFGNATEVLRHSRKFARVLGSTFNDVAVIYMRRREFDLAATNLHEALQYYDRALQQPCESDKRCGLSIDSLQVFRNLGECYMKKKDFAQASDAFLQVLNLQRHGRKVYESVKDLDLGIVGVEWLLVPLIDDESMADTLMRLGRASAAGEKHKEALTFFREAMEVLNRIGIADELSARLTDLSKRERGTKKDQVTNTLYCIAEESCAVGEYDEAIRAYGESMRRCSVLDVSRGQQETQSAIVHCTLCFVGIGNVHLKNQEYAAAYKLFNDTLSYCTRNGVPSTHSLTAMITHRIKDIEMKMEAETSKRLADLQILEDKAELEIKNEAYEQALATLKQSLAMRRTELVKLKASNDDTSEQIYGIARLLRSLGSVFARTGDNESARRAYSDATKIFKKSGAYEILSI
jgi:tetratricopeptide (TPR) repeat protein